MIYITTILIQIVFAHRKNLTSVIYIELRHTTKSLDLIKFFLMIQL